MSPTNIRRDINSSPIPCPGDYVHIHWIRQRDSERSLERLDRQYGEFERSPWLLSWVLRCRCYSKPSHRDESNHKGRLDVVLFLLSDGKLPHNNRITMKLTDSIDWSCSARTNLRNDRILVRNRLKIPTSTPKLCNQSSRQWSTISDPPLTDL